MASWATIPTVLATAGLLCWAGPACCADREAYKRAVEDLAASTHAPNPDLLAGIGQIYCQMKDYVGDTLPTDTALAVLHRQHPETRPKSRKERSLQTDVMNLAAQFLCPDLSPPSATPQ